MHRKRLIQDDQMSRTSVGSLDKKLAQGSQDKSSEFKFSI